MGTASDRTPRGGGVIDDRQAEAIDALGEPIAYQGRSRWRILAALPADRRWAYFRDQLLARVATVLAVVCVIAFLACRILTPQAMPRLTVAIVDDALGSQDAAVLQTQVADALDLPEGRDGGVQVDADFHLDDTGLSKLQTMLAADEIDVIVAEPDAFFRLAGYGYLRPLDEALDADRADTLRNRFIDAAGFDDSEATDIDYDGSGKGDVAAYGLDLTDADGWDAYDSAASDAVLGLAQDSRNTDTARRLVDLLLNGTAGGTTGATATDPAE